jgi:ABC-type transport system substrate-binding protein
MEVVPEDATRTAALQAGDADLIEANVLMTEQIESFGGEVAWQDESAYNWIVMVDCWEEGMWCFDKRVRQAVEIAVDRQTIVDQLYGRGATHKGWGHVTPNAMGYSAELDPPPFDLARAIALLAEAGIVDGQFNGEQVKFEIHTWDAGDTPLLPELSQLFADAWRDDLGFDVEVVVGDASAVRQKWNNRQLPGHVLVRTNEARFDGTSITSGGYNNADIAWRAVKDPDLEPWLSDTTIVVLEALGDLSPSRSDSFNKAYKVLKDDNQYWSAFYTNLPWGVGPKIKPGTYQPWSLVPYVTAIWTAEPAN